MRQASGDLFPSDSPIPASQLIGRRDDVAEIATRLEAGTHLIVAGPRRTGKTSVCEAALTRAKLLDRPIFLSIGYAACPRSPSRSVFQSSATRVSTVAKPGRPQRSSGGK